ncbi:hypothetical protein Glove_315g45 [Diversispora epigaea]|uniref:Uncharacterized protein n=1 Tax=Diversispora epigaea TaxID=1348612 RepID=A0A397HQL5_9GLOM|nr:hypothetical protein Glove_315g45 [Diversispora epigaea]
MHEELMKYVESNEIEKQNVPKVSTIQGWISRYAAAFKEQTTEAALRREKDNNEKDMIINSDEKLCESQLNECIELLQFKEFKKIQSIKKAPHRSAHRCLDCYAPATDRLRSINKASDRTLNHPHRTPNPRTIPLCVRPKNNVYLNIASVPIPGPFHRPNPPPDIDTRQKLCKNTIWNKNKPRQQPDQQLTL